MRVAAVIVADEPAGWRDAGFAVGDDGVCRIGTVDIRLVGRGSPTTTGERDDVIRAWELTHPGGTAAGVSAAGTATADALVADGLATTLVDDATVAATGRPPVAHPNGCVRIDHLVILTPDLDRTTAALGTLGLVPRRTREAGRRRDGTVTLQRFFRLGEVIVEVVGPAEPTGSGPSRFWGLAHVVADLEATVAGLGSNVSAARAAVQPGRHIATLRHPGVSVPTALMSAEPDRPVAGDDAGGTRGNHEGGR